MIEVLVVDDELVARELITVILDTEDDVEVVASAASGNAAVQTVRRIEPDVVVMDLAMPGMDGVATTRELLKGPGPSPRVLALTTFATEDKALEAIKAGAGGFCSKSDRPEVIAQAVRTVARGEPAVSPQILQSLLHRLTGPTAVLPGCCTTREVEVLRLVAAGSTNDEIADSLVVSKATVRTHVQHLRTKLQARSRAELVARAHHYGIEPLVSR